MEYWHIIHISNEGDQRKCEYMEECPPELRKNIFSGGVAPPNLRV